MHKKTLPCHIQQYDGFSFPKYFFFLEIPPTTVILDHLSLVDNLIREWYFCVSKLYCEFNLQLSG